jgi:hypothetical protein
MCTQVQQCTNAVARCIKVPEFRGFETDLSDLNNLNAAQSGKLAQRNQSALPVDSLSRYVLS